jgi:predicted NAD/FAD-binding protein
VRLCVPTLSAQVFDRPQWKTPAGRSRQYVGKIVERLGNALELGSAVTSVTPVS